jgi:low affinity Fe/Cu permease
MSGTGSDRRTGWSERLAHKTTNYVGTSWAFTVALATTVLWLAAGWFFHYSDTWQLVMNTISSIVTFLMVFLLQRSQNKDSLAMQLKLNELLGAIRGASNRLIDVEDLPEEQVRALHERYRRLSERLRTSDNTAGTASIEEAAAVRAQSPDA